MPRPSLIALIPSIALGVCAPPLAAQTVYRCGNTYSESPCAGGKAVKVEDPRTPAQQAQAKADFEGVKKSAKELERERLAEEDGQLPDKRGGPRKTAAGKNEPPARTDGGKPGSARPVMNYFTAIVPPPVKEKARKPHDKPMDAAAGSSVPRQP